MLMEAMARAFLQEVSALWLIALSVYVQRSVLGRGVTRGFL